MSICICVCLYVSVCACISLCVSVLIKQNLQMGCRDKVQNVFYVCIGKSKYSSGLEGKTFAFLWHAEILVASR